MKLIHLGDLHIGKCLLEQSLLDDQEYMLDQIIEIAKEQNIDGILISGDIYDKGVPNIDAVNLLNDFLNKIVFELKIKVFIISGNHDSKTRLNFGSKLLESTGLYIETKYNGNLKKVNLTDNKTIINIYMLPFIKLSEINHLFDTNYSDYTEAFKKILNKEIINKDEINILMAHQFVTYNREIPELSDSENINIGNVDNIDANIFFDFDYVALGHIHKPQKIGKDNIRYSGTMLKYSFSEVNHNKSLVLININNKNIDYELIPLKPLRDLREIKGPIEELLKYENYKDTNTSDYIKAIITNEETVYDPLNRIRTVYPNTLKLEINNSKTISNINELEKIEKLKEKSLLELFNEFYKYQNNIDMNQNEVKIIEEIIESISEVE